MCKDNVQKITAENLRVLQILQNNCSPVRDSIPPSREQIIAIERLEKLGFGSRSVQWSKDTLLAQAYILAMNAEAEFWVTI